MIQTPRPNDIWQLPCGRLADVIAAVPGLLVDEAFTEQPLMHLHQRLLICIRGCSVR